MATFPRSAPALPVLPRRRTLAVLTMARGVKGRLRYFLRWLVEVIFILSDSPVFLTGAQLVGGCWNIQVGTRPRALRRYYVTRYRTIAVVVYKYLRRTLIYCVLLVLFGHIATGYEPRALTTWCLCSILCYTTCLTSCCASLNQPLQRPVVSQQPPFSFALSTVKQSPSACATIYQAFLSFTLPFPFPFDLYRLRDHVRS